MYTVDYFINKFEAIPEEYWTAGSLGYLSKHCANGHCGVTDYNKPTAEASALAKLLSPLRQPHWCKYGGVFIYEITANINDGEKPYNQPTPKQRILAALYDIKNMQSKHTEVKKEKIVYVAVPVTITEQAKELVMS